MDILERRLREMAGVIDARFDALEFRSLPGGGREGDMLTKSGPNPFTAEWSPGITVGPVAPAAPELNQLWVDTN